MSSGYAAQELAVLNWTLLYLRDSRALCTVRTAQVQTMESEQSWRMSGEGQSNVLRALGMGVIIFLVLISSTFFHNSTGQNHIIRYYLGDLKELLNLENKFVKFTYTYTHTKPQTHN